MDAEMRRRRMLELARRAGSVDVVRLAAGLKVSKETVRRDLTLLEEHGLVRRTHGGAHPVESAGFETTLAFRTTHHVPEKSRIASAAAGLLGDAETVFVDEGFTPRLVAEALPDDRPLTVVTASVAVAATFASRRHATVMLLGGRLRGGTMATVDQWAVRMLSAFVVDLAYVGANGVCDHHGLTTPDPAVRDVKAQAMRVSRRRVLIGVHTKFGLTSFCRFAGVGDVQTIVTDTGLTAERAQRYARLGPQVLRV
ncbi:MAG TPA: DeoR/GlpR family DNA-binding transcription regulator [Streptomyces sp.]|nr:DeoR/GlpR family DNA-binding transcription regulator [Streptomyces sp.]